MSLIAPAARADPAAFDLKGPTVSAAVTRGARTLPIGEVPNLMAGDRLAVSAAPPPGQSVHYELVAVFLKGAADPPPRDWFHVARTWLPGPKGRLDVVVPPGAEQALVLLAPETRGDLKTLVEAVRGRPGAFVRAAQDLGEAGLERARLDAFLGAIKASDPSDPDRLKTISPLLARSLMVKLNPDCLQKAPDLQAACLSQGSDQLVLSDGRSASMVETLTSGASADLATQLSATPQARFGYYSPYLGAVLDMARILESFRTAQYQYIPALAVTKGADMALVLNTPPSFHAPQSVMVAALPPVGPATPPAMRPVDPGAATCLAAPAPVLAVEDAPLAFAAAYAHDMDLRVTDAAGRALELPARADAETGGFVVEAKGLASADMATPSSGVLHGQWGFDAFDGPRFRLASAGPEDLTLAPEDAQGAQIGRDDVLRLRGAGAACVTSVAFRQDGADAIPAKFAVEAPDTLAVTVPLADAESGPFTLDISSHGRAAPARVKLMAFAQAGRLDGFELHQGEMSGVLTGARLDEVAGARIGAVALAPEGLTTLNGADQLTLAAEGDGAALQRLSAGDRFRVRVALKDGRTLSVKGAVAPPRPTAIVMQRTVRPPPPVGPVAGAPPSLPIRLLDADAAPAGSVMTFSLHALPPTRFAGGDVVQVATEAGAAVATLKVGQGLTVEDPGVAVAVLDTTALGPDAYGPLRFRLVQRGVADDWRPLGRLVRLPKVSGVRCPARGACAVSGTDLFLIDAISARPDGADGLTAPDGFTGASLPSPHPSQGRLFLRLHDDPGAPAELQTAAAKR